MAAAVEKAKQALEQLKSITLEVSMLCNHPSTNESRLRKGLADLCMKMRTMEPQWEQLSPGKKTSIYRRGHNGTKPGLETRTYNQS